MTLTNLAIPATDFDLRQHVLRGRTDDLVDTSRFEDTVWHLNPGERLRNRPKLSLHFETVPPAFVEATKQLSLSLLRGSNQPRGKTYAISTIREVFGEVRRFTAFLQSKSITSLSQVDNRVLAEYVGFLSTQTWNTGNNLRAVRFFWLYRDDLTTPLRADPALLPFWRAPRERPLFGDTLTSRIPEDVYGAVLGWATAMVQNMATDIAAALEAHARLQRDPRKIKLTSERHIPSTGVRPRGIMTDRVTRLLDEYERSGRPLPGHATGTRWAGKPNYLAIDREAQASLRTSMRSLQTRIDFLATKNGVDDDTYLDVVPQGRIAGSVWATRITYLEAPGLGRMLQVACWILIAAFSGMRDAEVKHIQRGCVQIHADATGLLREYTLTARAWKGNDQPSGIAATWVVAPIVADAVKVLESMQPQTETYLFRALGGGWSHHSRAGRKIITSGETNSAMDDFVEWINARFGHMTKEPPIPAVDGVAWPLRTRQFRKTLAWFIARKPGGIAAGALQFKHLSLQMFRGYAGSDDSGFAAEVAAEAALARGEWIGSFVSQAEAAVGPAAEEVRRRLQATGAVIAFAGALPENARQMQSLLRRHDAQIYRGSAVICVFDPAKALCKRRKPSLANLGDCQPLQCGNAAFTPDDVARWREHADGLLQASGNETLAPAVRDRAEAFALKTLAFFEKWENA